MKTAYEPYSAANYASSKSGASDDRTMASLMVTRMFAALQGLHSQWRRGLGLNAHESIATTTLWECGPMTMSELGERIPLSRAAVTSLVDRLEIKGFVRRAEDPSDRRRTLLEVTEDPAAMLEPVWVPFAEQIAAVANRFSDEEWRTICWYQDQIIELCGQHADTLRQQSNYAIRELLENPA
jgi:DNA-binding MarR family transcriptional regulator